jgi:hypothetical protein
MAVEHQFTSVNDLRDWLEERRWEAGSPEAYDEWLRSYFDDGNTIYVNETEYDYWACWELL